MKYVVNTPEDICCHLIPTSTSSTGVGGWALLHPGETRFEQVVRCQAADLPLSRRGRASAPSSSRAARTGRSRRRRVDRRQGKAGTPRPERAPGPRQQSDTGRRIISGLSSRDKLLRTMRRSSVRSPPVNRLPGCVRPSAPRRFPTPRGTPCLNAASCPRGPGAPLLHGTCSHLNRSP